jgi:hypothetical protein
VNLRREAAVAVIVQHRETGRQGTAHVEALLLLPVLGLLHEGVLEGSNDERDDEEEAHLHKWHRTVAKCRGNERGTHQRYTERQQ